MAKTKLMSAWLKWQYENNTHQTKGELARMLEVSRPTLRRYLEEDIDSIDYVILDRFCAKLNCKRSDIVVLDEVTHE